MTMVPEMIKKYDSSIPNKDISMVWHMIFVSTSCAKFTQDYYATIVDVKSEWVAGIISLFLKRVKSNNIVPANNGSVAQITTHQDLLMLAGPIFDKLVRKH